MPTRLPLAAVFLVSCGPAKPSAFTHDLEPGLTAKIPQNVAKPLAAVRGESGDVQLFVADELLVRPQSQAELDALLERVGGTVVETDAVPAPPASLGKTLDPQLAQPTQYVVRVDLAKAKLAQLDADASRAGLRGRTFFSDEKAAKLVALVAQEKAGGRLASPNFVFQGTLVERLEEQLVGGGYWDTMTAAPYVAQGSRSNVVGLWQYVAARPPGRRTYVAIIDGGFWLDAAGHPMSAVTPPVFDLPQDPVQYDFAGDDYLADGPNPASCTGGGGCPWHGNGSAGTAVGRVNNRYGGSGTGGQVADPMLFKTSLDWGQTSRAIRTAVAWGADVISMSFSGNCDNAFCDLFFEGNLYPALRNARDNGVVMVAAAGNDFGSANGQVPCKAAEDVICVGALSAGTPRAVDYSNSGSSVAIWAPSDIWTHPAGDTTPDLAYFNGTSASTPFVAGVAAVMRAYDPTLSSARVKEVLQNTGWRGSPDPKVTIGLDAYRAVRAVAPVFDVAPHLAIVADSGTTAELNRPFQLRARSYDLEDGSPCCTVTWTPTPSATADNGRRATFTFTAVGPQSVTARATDRSGNATTTTLVISVRNSPPVAQIVLPAEAVLTVLQGQQVQFLGRALDANEPFGVLACPQLRWTSDLPSDSAFPRTGCEQFVTFASTGTRIIRLEAADPQGQGSLAWMRVIVTAPPTNLPPNVTLSPLPAPNYTDGYAADANLTVNATATDPEGNTPLTFRWYVTTFAPNSSTTVYSARSLLGTASTGQLTWRPDSPPSRFGTFSSLGNDCYDGQQVLLELDVSDSLGNRTTRALPRFKVYVCQVI